MAIEGTILTVNGQDVFAVEVPARRDAHTKHYRLPNGSFRAISQANQHYPDRDTGRWEPTDYRITSDENPGAAGFSHAALRTPYRPRFGKSGRVRFGFGFRVGRGEFVTYRPQGASPNVAPAIAMDGLSATYSNPWPGADVTYRLMGSGIKLDIVLRDASAPASFTFDLVERGNVTPVLTGDGGVWFQGADGQMVGRIHPPTVKDAAGAEGPVRLVWADAAGTVTLEVDQAWLADPARVWPVTVDPTTTTIQPDAAAGKDACYREEEPTINFGTSNLLEHIGPGYYAGNFYERESVAQFDLSSIPSGATIISAVLSLKLYQTNGGYGTNSIGAYGITTSWAENTVTWNSKPSKDAAATATTNVPPSGVGNWYDWTITSLVQAWHSGTRSNYGVLLKVDSGNNYSYFYSSDHSVADDRPKLVVQYNQAPSAPTGLSPSGSAINVLVNNTFSWTFNDPDSTDNQTSYQLIITRVSDGATILDTGKTESSTSSRVVPANTLQGGVQYQWKVRTWDPQDVAGPYSDLATVSGSMPPTCTITSPADAGTYTKGRMTVQWTYSDPESEPQSSYQARLLDSTGTAIIESSGWVTGAGTSHTFVAVVENGTSYRVKVTVRDNANLEGTDTNSFTVNYALPPTPTITVTPNDTADTLTIQITNPAGSPATDYNDVYRSDDGGATWKRIAKNVAVNGSYADYTPGSGKTYQYKARAWSVDVTPADSSAQSGSITVSQGIRLHDVADAAGTALLLSNALERGDDYDWAPALFQFAGRSLPVAEFGEHEARKYEADIRAMLETTEWANLLALAQRKATLCVRDFRGRRFFAVIPSLPERDLNYGQDIRLRLVAVHYNEEV